MAKIDSNNLNLKTLNRNSVHEVVQATYCSFRDNQGVKYLQIDTYGKANRAYAAQASQKIQFDKNTAIKLIGIMKQVFNLN